MQTEVCGKTMKVTRCTFVIFFFGQNPSFARRPFMHMADALISPAVGGTMWAASAVLIAYSSKKVKGMLDDRMAPLMGVLGAFVFAAQMINFTIPGTGSSGHIGGGMILAILLGPYAAFLTLASVLFVQALFFADGGLLALGCNIFNLGFFPAMVAYPLIYRSIAGKPTQRRVVLGSILSAVIALQMGAFCVVLQTSISHVADLSFSSFVLLMQPIHLAIGFVEGLVTAAVVLFTWKARPEILEPAKRAEPNAGFSIKRVFATIVLAAVLTAGFVTWFASSHPDGLEWALFRLTGKEDAEPHGSGSAGFFNSLQDKTAILPDYHFKAGDLEESKKGQWPAADPATSVSGLIGGAMTLAVALLIGVSLKKRKKRCRE
jgi:cobalt/nickel transport system permease protein